MAFKTSDFKKTSRGTGEQRQIYPHQIRDDRYTAAIGFAIAYFERMVGRKRGEFEADTLLEFFGDPRLARGLVACLARTYAWRMPDFSEALGSAAGRSLSSAGIQQPSDLRARLYRLANAGYGGFIPPDLRREALYELGLELQTEQHAALPPALLEQALILDSEDQQILAKLGPTPSPEQIVARYNYHSLETALCYAERIQIKLEGPIWVMLRSAHNLTRRYRIGYGVGSLPGSLFDNQIDLHLHGKRDALGGWGRAGRRLTRALLRMLAAHPGSAKECTALVHIGGKRALLKLDTRTLKLLGAGAGDSIANEAWEDQLLDEFQRSWGRLLVRGRTEGWRLRRDPEPLVHEQALVVPDFALRRGNQGLALCFASGRASAEALAQSLNKLERSTPVVVLAHSSVAGLLRGSKANLVTYSTNPTEAIPRLIATLERLYPRTKLPVAPSPWQTLEQRVSAEGFLDEQSVASILNCTTEEATGLVRRWGGPKLHVLSGLGVCDNETLGEIRQMLDRAA